MRFERNPTLRVHIGLSHDKLVRLLMPEQDGVVFVVENIVTG